MDNVFAFAEEFSMRTEASYSSLCYVGFLQDFEVRAVSWYRRVHRQRAGFAVVSDTASHVHRH